MNTSVFLSFRFLWILLVTVNFIIQLAYYFNDRSNGLFVAKKVTTPLLLFFALLIVVIETHSFPIIPCVILLAMGVGELGIEGSSVVETREEDSKNAGKERFFVLMAGVLFLLVNVFIGIRLIIENTIFFRLIIAGATGILIIALMLIVTFKFSRPLPEVRNQMIIYSAGLAVLLTGVLCDVFNGISPLGQAAVILTVSDSLVLIRMGAGFNKTKSPGFRILLVFLIVILILYYFYMWLLMNTGSGTAL